MTLILSSLHLVLNPPEGGTCYLGLIFPSEDTQLGLPSGWGLWPGFEWRGPVAAPWSPMRGPGAVSIECHSFPLCFAVLGGLSLLAIHVTSEGPKSLDQLEVPSTLLGFLEKGRTAEEWTPYSEAANAVSSLSGPSLLGAQVMWPGQPGTLAVNPSIFH
jgi:hypothetical protein